MNTERQIQQIKKPKTKTNLKTKEGHRDRQNT